MNTPLHEEARSYGLDPIKYKSLDDIERDVLAQRAMRQARHAPQQPDVDSGNAKEVTPLHSEPVPEKKSRRP